MRPAIGTNIGDYSLLVPLGKGGTANLWKAKHLLSKKIVAIKILGPDNNIQRVRNEARLQSSVLHPNIVAIYEFIWMGKQPCIVMEWVQGKMLDEYIQSKNLSFSERIYLIEQLVNAIDYLHERKIIHRDLKPQNIMIRPDGHLKLLDFGIAKGWSSPDLTKVGTAIGTPEYMAPERFQGQQSPQSDIWAIGLIIYELVTNQPFFNKIRNTESRKKAFKKFKIEEKIKTTNEPWQNVILNCLKANPKSRYSSVKKIMVDLEQRKSSIKFKTPAINIDKAKKPVLILISLLFIGLLGFWSWKSLGRKEECIGVQQEFIIKPSHAILITSKGKVLEKGSWILCGLPGSTTKFTLQADKYYSRTMNYTFPQKPTSKTLMMEKKDD